MLNNMGTGILESQDGLWNKEGAGLINAGSLQIFKPLTNDGNLSNERHRDEPRHPVDFDRRDAVSTTPRAHSSNSKTLNNSGLLPDVEA